MPSEQEITWIKVMPDILLGIICVSIVYETYQQIKKAATCGNELKH